MGARAREILSIIVIPQFTVQYLPNSGGDRELDQTDLGKILLAREGDIVNR